MILIKESSLSRVLDHIHGEYPFAIITAFRGNFSYKENILRNKILAAEIKTAGHGYFFIEGYWIENKGMEDEKKVSEDSIFVICKSGLAPDIFVKQMLTFANQWDQESIIIKTTPNKISCMDSSGNIISNISDFHPDSYGDEYSKLKHSDRTFIFESISRPESSTEKYMNYLAGL